VNADRLRAVQQALLRDFANDTTAPCSPRRVDLVYAHIASIVAPDALLALTYPAFETRVDAWDWVTTTRYEQCDVIKSNQPYRDFIRARFLWQERPNVRLTRLPPAADPPDATAIDGGTLIFIHTGQTLGTGASVAIHVQLPAAPAAPNGYPGRRRVCLSIPGQAGSHTVLEAGVNDADVQFPAPDNTNALHLVGEMPWFRLQFPQGTDLPDPWDFPIGAGYSTAAQHNQHLFEVGTGTDVGSVWPYGSLYGLHQPGEDTKATVRSAYATDLSPSRRFVVTGVLGAEGGPSAVASYDGAGASWGMNQWNSRDGEFEQLFCFLWDFFPDAFQRCFGRYGIGVRFTARHATWSPHGTYGGPVILRVPCCTLPYTHSIRTGLDAIGTHLEEPQVYGTIASSFPMGARDYVSAAMLFLLFVAGHDADVQKAQVQWTSYRITFAKAELAGNPTNDQVMDQFFVSLGSAGDRPTRMANGHTSIATGTQAGNVYPRANAVFSDTGTTLEWRDWPTRCTNAHKPTT
jgi:hypothetical protein